MAKPRDIVDLTRGVYRKIYSGFIHGKKINAVSVQAEAWFWRIHATADDFGNQRGDDLDIHAATRGKRQVSVNQVVSWVKELVAAKLVRRYVIDEENYIHINHFRDLQPSGPNGRPIRRHPEPLETDDASPQTGCVESGGIQKNPEESGCSHTHTHTHNDTQDDAFAEFWALWPKSDRKDDRKKCLKAWHAAQLDDERGVVMASLRAWLASEQWAKDDGAWIPAPLTWLHKERWLITPKPRKAVAAENGFTPLYPTDEQMRNDLGMSEDDIAKLRTM